MKELTDLTAQVDQTIPASGVQIWQALTTPATLKKFFFGADVDSDWKAGSPIRFKGEFKGKPYEDKGEILAVEPPQRKKTQVTLTQSNLKGGVTASDVAHRADYEKNWATVLQGLASLFA